jgi:hypothetical protein
MKKGDLVLIISTIVIIFVFLFINRFSMKDEGDNIAVVSVDGKTVKEINLDNINDEYEIKLTEAEVTLKVKRGAICFYESYCENKYCIKSGWITENGEKAVCLPQKTQIVIENNQDEEIDSVSH